MKTEVVTAKPLRSGPSPTPPSGHRAQEQKRILRRIVPVLGGIVVVGLLVYGFWPEPAPVETAKASRGLLRISVQEEGKTRIKNRFTISAPVAGQLRRIPFKAGAEVTAKETILAWIDPVSPAMLDARSRSLAEARRETAAAQLERAKAAHKFAETELRRVEKLAQNSTVSQQELEYSQLRETSAAKDVLAAEANLRMADAELAEFKEPSLSTNATPVAVRSPVTGRVLRLYEESSRVVAGGTPLLDIGDPRDLEAVIEVLSRDGATIPAGARVELEQWGGSKPLEGRVRLVEPAAFTKISALGVEEQRVNVVVDITSPVSEWGNLGDHFRVEGRIISAEIADALKVPAGAVFRQGADPAVFLLRNGRAKLQLLTIGLRSPSEVQVLDGLKEGEEVIVYPGDRIRDGNRVRPIIVGGN